MASGTAAATVATTGLMAGVGVGGAAMMDMGMLGSAFSAYSSIQQGNAQSDMFNYQAEVTQQQNDLATYDRLQKADRLMSSQTAQFGAMGTEFAGGSAQDVVARTASDAQFDIFNDTFTSTTNQGALRTSAKSARQTGRTNAAASLLDFGTKAGSILA